jgi:hypothetical protein
MHSIPIHNPIWVLVISDNKESKNKFVLKMVVDVL